MIERYLNPDRVEAALAGKVQPWDHNLLWRVLYTASAGGKLTQWRKDQPALLDLTQALVTAGADPWQQIFREPGGYRSDRWCPAYLMADRLRKLKENRAQNTKDAIGVLCEQLWQPWLVTWLDQAIAQPSVTPPALWVAHALGDDARLMALAIKDPPTHDQDDADWLVDLTLFRTVRDKRSSLLAAALLTHPYPDKLARSYLRGVIRTSREGSSWDPVGLLRATRRQAEVALIVPSGPSRPRQRM